MNIAVGQPTKVTKIPHLKEEQMDELHKKCFEALKWLFETYKEKYGVRKDVTLTI